MSARRGDGPEGWPDPKVYEHWHEADRRALEMMCLTVAKIDADRSLLGIGMENLTRWRHHNGGDQARWCERWEAWFERGEPWERIRALLLEDSDEGQRLRTSHPFAGVLTDEERESVCDFDCEALKRDYERRPGRPWPTTREMVIAQFGWPGGAAQPPFAPAWRRAMEEGHDPGAVELRRVLADARPQWPTTVLGPNRNGGRDLVIGDLHGHFPTLERALDALGFDANADRLFAVGDLIDRGPESERALEWLESGRITAAVRGNHEQMMADAFAFGDTLTTLKSGPGARWLINGGDWWYGSEAVRRESARRGPERPFALAERWAATLAHLPYMMVIESARGRVGVVHASGFANYAKSWDVVWEDAQRLGPGETGRARWARPHQERNLLWADAEQFAERRDDARIRGALPGIDLVITGHSPGPGPRWARRNVVCIDTGVHYAEWGHLTVAEVQGPEPALHRFARSPAPMATARSRERP